MARHKKVGLAADTIARMTRKRSSSITSVSIMPESAMTALNRPIRLKRLSWQSDTQ